VAIVTAAGSFDRAIDDLTSFDGGWYSQIVRHGYTYAPGAQHDVAFFPLYPAIVWALTRIGISFNTASLLVSNAAFLGALLVAFQWVRRHCGARAARWTVATLCCSPMSLFCSAAYSESLFLLLTGAALWDWERGRSRASALWAALASATRLMGIALAPAFVLGREWLQAVAAIVGVVAFALYCAVRFGDPLAFIHVETTWRSSLGFDLDAWSKLLGAGLTTAPWLHVIALITGAVLWLTRRRAPFGLQFVLWLIVVEAERWAWNGTEYVFLFTLVAAALALVFRRQVGMVPIAYLLAGLVLIAFAGQPVSVDRSAFGLLPVSIALALLWQRIPALGSAALLVMTIDLFEFSVKFAHRIFVA